METMTGSISDTVRTTTRGEEISETVVDAVADAKDVDPLDLDPLYDAIDPDALDSLFGRSAGSGGSLTELRFAMAGCEVLVHGDGEVVVTQTTGADESPERRPSRE